MYSSYLRFKKFISALTIALFAVVNPLLSFAPAAYASEGDAQDAVVAAPVDTPSDQPSDIATPSDTPAPTEAPAPSDSPAPTDTPAVSDTTPSVDPTPAPDVTPAPATSSDPVNTDDGVWQMLPNGKALTRDAVNMSTTYVAPQNPKVTVHFTQLPDTAGNLTIQEIKLTADQQKQLGALSDTAYDISSNMENGTFKYDLTLPNPAGDKNATVKYAEDVAGLDNAQAVTQRQSSDEDNTTVSGLNHFTVFVLVNDTDTDGTPNNGNEIANGVLTPIIDAYIDENSPSSNHGTSTDLSVKSKTSQNQRSFIKFDTTPIGSDTPAVTKATLRVYMNNAPSSGRTINLNRVTSTWTEGTVTWNAQPSTSSTIATASVGTAANQWVEFDVTSEVQAILNGTTTNYGWELADSSEGSGTTYQTQFNSGNNGTELRRPQLVVDFATATASPTQYNSPSAASADTGGDGNGYETTVSGAFADAGSVAADMHTPASTQGDRERFYNYNFSIPAGATINGIETRADWNVDDTAGTNSLSVDLSWDGGSTWTSSKTDITETDHEHVTSFGSSSDTWGRTWSVGDFSNSNFRVRVTDSGTTDSRDFYLDWIPVRVYYTPAVSDTTAPAVPTLVSPASGSIIKSSAATLDWSDSSDPSSPVTYKYQSSLSNAVGANNGFVTPLYTSGSLATSQIDATGSAEGVYYWQARACDSLNNCSDWSGPWKVTIDNTKPVIAFHSPVVAEATSASGATVTYTAPATSDNVDANGTASCLPASGTLFAMGNTAVTCNATDTAGNTATPTNFTVTVHDTTAPVITLVGSNPETVELGGTYTDAGATASDNIDGNITGNIVTTGTVNTSAVGSYTKYYNVSDAALNPATQVTRTVNVVDTTKPAVPSLVSPANGSVIKPAAATLDWTDETDLSNPVTYVYQSSLSNSVGANNGFTSPIYTSGSLATSQIDATGSADNMYYWQVRACDALNNCSDWSGPWQVTIDGTAPVTTDSGTDGNWHNSNVTVTLSCTDSASGCDVIYWSIDGTPTATTHDGTGSSVVVSTTGIHTIKYFSVDQAGNEESVKTAANTVKIDKVTPGIPLIAGIVSPTNNPIVSWTWGAVADADSGLQHYQYMLRDAASTIIDSGFTTLTNYSHTFSVSGVYTFFLRAIDNAGNKGTGATSSVTLDVSAPDNPSADNAGGNYASPVTVALTSNDPTVNGVSSNPTTIYYTTDGTNPDSSSTLYVGAITINQDTTLKAIAYDAVGNTSGIMTEVYYVAPVISDVSSSANSNPASERVIHWTTNINSDSRLVFGTTSVSDTDATTAGSPQYGYSKSSDHVDISPNGVVTHTVTIAGLNSFTTYFYRVISAETLATLSAEYSFGTEATDGTPGPNGDSSGSGSSSSSSSSSNGKVLGATTKASPTPTPVVISGTSVDLESTNPGAGTGNGSNGSGSGVAGTSTSSASPRPSVSPSPEVSPTITPEATPNVQDENGKAFQWSWWWLVLLAIIAGGIWWFRRRNNTDTNIPA